MKPLREPVPGEPFGRWTVVEAVPGGNGARVRVRCACGVVRELAWRNVLNGGSLGCRGKVCRGHFQRNPRGGDRRMPSKPPPRGRALAVVYAPDVTGVWCEQVVRVEVVSGVIVREVRANHYQHATAQRLVRAIVRGERRLIEVERFAPREIAEVREAEARRVAQACAQEAWA